MTLRDTIRETFAAERRPAVRLRELNDRVRAQGAACTPDALRRELRAAPDLPLRIVDGSDPLLADLSDALPDPLRPSGLDDVVVDARPEGLRPTAADAVRVLARRLRPGGRTERARWARLLRQVESGSVR